MRFPKTSKTISLVICVALILVFSTASSQAQEPTAISGKISAVYTHEDSIGIGDAAGHVVSLTKSEGTNANTGKQDFMDGAKVFNTSFSDVVKGNGNHQGYVVFAKGSDTTIAKWKGMITTTSAPEGKSVIQMEGTFTYIYGTGNYKGISGSGTYKGSFATKSEYSAEWKGEYILKH
jgi:hypothetical protein